VERLARRHDRYAAWVEVGDDAPQQVVLPDPDEPVMKYRALCTRSAPRISALRTPVCAYVELRGRPAGRASA
jgi:hypothetical protein